jgi:hypothetical protein
MPDRIGIVPTKFLPSTNAFSTHANVLPGYTWAGEVGRYRANATGRFVARRDILGLLESTTAATEKQVANLTTAVMEGRISTTVWQEQMRVEVKRQVLSQTALGSGGWDRISQAGYGRAGADLRQLYGKISGTAADIADGTITMAQAQARANEYAGHARSHFYSAEREVVQPTAPNKVFIERRMLGAGGRTCKSCVDYYDQGWSNFALLPPPGIGSECGGHCKCVLIRMEVEAGEVASWLGTKR